ncbi:adenomatous polyposis coli protein 2 isoform X2 [Ambystoma mexicanum]|uniref:adenomatous polyposis coli protein 2 isoform X2 n=1 Tax=Ambystoma mexicanum TaxID=8296 RepID=UPI0037E85572
MWDTRGASGFKGWAMEAAGWRWDTRGAPKLQGLPMDAGGWRWDARGASGCKCWPMDAAGWRWDTRGASGCKGWAMEAAGRRWDTRGAPKLQGLAHGCQRLEVGYARGLWLQVLAHGCSRLEVLEEFKMAGSIASYDQLVRQVEALKKENSHLRRELEDNSSHLSKLENETSDMKEVLKHLQGKLEQEARVMVSSGRTEVLEQLKALQMDITGLYNLQFPTGNRLVGSDVTCGPLQGPEDSPPHSVPLQKKGSLGDLSRAVLQHLEELDKERCFLLGEIEKEEKEKLWYYTQLQSLSKRLAELPHMETFSMQMDLIRQQLEFESRHIRSLLEERFGTSDEMVQRAQIRASRLEQIETELVGAQENVQQNDAQACGKQEDGGAGGKPHPTEASSPPSNKVEVVFWLLSMLATRDKDEMARTLLAMSSSQDSCLAMRKSGCLPLLIQILHDADRDPSASENVGLTAPATNRGSGGGGGSKDARMHANAALHNIIFSQPDEGQAKREMRVLHVLEQVRSYSETCWDWLEAQEKERGGGKQSESTTVPVSIEPQICQATCAVMKLSFDEEYRRAMNELGGLQAVAELLQVDYEMHKMTNDPLNLALRRYAGMALTNLTFGDVVNKATLSSRRGSMQAIVAHLASESEELHQVVSSILRNLSWRADINSKKTLREVGSVTGLMQCALRATKESTLKSVLSALWNLSAHSTENKAAVCAVEGALGFLVSTLTYKCQSNSLAIIESGGGILRNVSSLVATRDDYRQVLRDHNCLQTLLQHLKSHSLTIVSNACGTLWNLSARNPKDQELLWDLGGVSMLRNLIHSKHKMIAMGSAAALRNLLTNRPLKYKDATVISPGSCMPSLYMRKQKALEAELDAKHLAETFETMEKQGLKSQALKKPLRHMESLVKDYASDSGCFDDDDIPNVSSGVETGTSSVLSMFLNSSFLQGQALPRGASQRRGTEPPEKDENCKPLELMKRTSSEDDVSIAAEKLASKLSSTVAKIDKLVEDISTMHTSSDDSFSLSSEDHCLDWHYASDDLHEARAQSCSPCRLSDTSGLAKCEGLSRAHTLLRLKTAYTSLSNDSLNSGSTSDGYCTKEHMKPCTRAPFLDYKEELQQYQKRPSRLDLKHVLVSRPEKGEPPWSQAKEHPAQEKADFKDLYEKAKKTAAFPNSHSIQVSGGKELQWKTDPAAQLSAETGVQTIKLSPTYQHIPVMESMAGSSLTPGVGFPSSAYHPSLASRKQAWLPIVPSQLCDNLSKGPERLSAHTPPGMEPESAKKYSVEGTPICFSRCSSLSSISSADNILDGREMDSENEMDSESSLDLNEVEEGEGHHGRTYRRPEEEEQGLSEGSAVTPSGSHPMTIPCPKPEKIFLRETSPSRNEDMTPSSSSENYIHETPLVMSRCSSVSSLGSFESPSIASSIQSDPCSGMISGTISPSELPDSPGQTMPPSRSKTPCFDPCGHPERETSQFNIQWENNVKKFMEITDFKERFHIPPDIDSMIYFTVEKPTENFSCASSLSALPLHEHYIQKDVELKLIPPFPERSHLNFVGHEKREDGREDRTGDMFRRSERHELYSEEDTDILKECINSAMPARLQRMKTSLLASLPSQPHNAQTKRPLHLPVYMLVPASTQLGGPRTLRTDKELFMDDSSITDSAEGTPVNFSSTASLSDETLQYPMKDEVDPKNYPRARSDRKDRESSVGCIPDGAQRRQEMRRRCPSQENMAAPTSIKTSAIPAVRVHSLQKQRGTPNVASGFGVRSTNTRDARTGQQALPLKRGAHLDLSIERHYTGSQQEGSPQRTEDIGRSNRAFQSICHTTPTEEAVYCFYENDSDDSRKVTRDSPRKTKESLKASRKQSHNTGPARKENTQAFRQSSHPKHKMPTVKLQNNLIVDETPPCYSLSSSTSSSDLDIDQSRERTKQTKMSRNVGLARKLETAICRAKDRQDSRSSKGRNSEDDALPKYALSAPKKRRHSARRRNADRKQKQQNSSISNQNTGKERPSELGPKPDEDGLSDKGSDLDSVQWQAIQEGANSIVTWLHQAAASYSREPSSESESILSFMSGLSMGSTLQRSLERKATSQRKKYGISAGRKDYTKSLQDTKKLQEPRHSSERNNSANVPAGPQKPTSNLPVVFRGRTVIYVPKVDKTSPTPLSTQKKISDKESTHNKAPAQIQPRSRSLHRPAASADMTDLSLPKRSSTPPARMPKGPSSGSSRNSTPSRQPQKKLPSPSQSNNKPLVAQRAKTALSQPVPNSKIQNKSSSPNNKTQKSPVRIPFMQKQSPRGLPARATTSVSAGQVNETRQGLGGPRSFQTNRLNLVRMSSMRSSSSESDRSGFLRQLTFIKESSNLLMHHRSDGFSSGTRSPLAQRGSPRRSVQPGLPAVFLCSSRCEELKAQTPTGNGQKPVVARALPPQKTPVVERPPRRTSSESPSRLPVKPSTSQPETFKRYYSSPQISISRRSNSPTSNISSCAESFGRRRSEERPSRLPPQKAEAGQQLALRKGTWKRIRDEDIPQILRSTLPSSALPLVNSSAEDDASLSPADIQRKTSDAVVQTEDFAITKTNSSTSPTLESAPPSSQNEARGSFQRHIGSSTVQDGSFYGGDPIKSIPTISFSHEGPSNSVGNFPPSRHSSPSKAMRVTPFNYTPSPIVAQAVSEKAVEKLHAE